jgi:thiamine pyrophosphate-dependent acetolactate synthase large subunit-like protein
MRPIATQEASRQSGRPLQTLSQAIVETLSDLGVRYAFGVSGGAIASLWGALTDSDIKVAHFRHETGAAFAAIEAHFVTNAPVVVFTTTGPGLTNALTGMLAARREGAKIILVSACTTAAYRGRWSIQETDNDTMPLGLTTSGALFHFATVIESAEGLPQIFRRVANGLARPGGFVCHLSVPTGLQTHSVMYSTPSYSTAPAPIAPADSLVEKCASLLAEGPIALWVGYGARAAADRVRALAERLGAAVMCSPRAKGLFPEDHPLFVGVTGMGGHDTVQSYMKDHPPRRILVLGTRLGEPTSFWNPALIPAQGFIHVDIDPDVPGVAYPTAPTLAVCADIGLFIDALLQRLPVAVRAASPSSGLPKPALLRVELDGKRRVRPEALMAAIQRIVIDRHRCLVMAESGNSFAWATHHLRFRHAGQYRVSTGVGSMGHCAAGVVGAALAGRRAAVAIVGDGAMLMNNEVNTAVKLGVPAVWIVLNDSRYNMCEQGMAVLGLQADAGIPEVDFATLARAMGAAGEIVASELELDRALETAVTAERPFVLDIRIDPTCPAPSMARNRGLRALGVGNAPVSHDVSFPARP